MNQKVEMDTGVRWEKGMDHHPKSMEVKDLIYKLDKEGMYNFGGDGDNGEEILYYLDIYFELKDLEQNV